MSPHPTYVEEKKPAKIGARNSSFASSAFGVGVRLREPFSQPDAQARSRGRNTRITRGDFRGVFSCSGWVGYTYGTSTVDLTENGTSSYCTVYSLISIHSVSCYYIIIILKLLNEIWVLQCTGSVPTGRTVLPEVSVLYVGFPAPLPRPSYSTMNTKHETPASGNTGALRLHALPFLTVRLDWV